MASSQLKVFGDTAKSLSRNPLGIVALFIVMVYGFACLVTAFTGSFTIVERLPLIYFLIAFPILVLAVFTWLVSRHSNKLFAPSDFKDEENYMKMQMSAVASLTVAASKSDGHPSAVNLNRIVDLVRSAGSAPTEDEDGWRSRILWVDDRPENNSYERRAFEAVGVRFKIALSTNEALEEVDQLRFAAIISDMGRAEGPREGYVLLDHLRSVGNRTPLFFYASSNAPEHKRETERHGGQGCTNDAEELFGMVMRAIVERQSA
jgi:CheY-like chemotaxis protein